MKKIKPKERSENTLQAFFDNEKLEDSALSVCETSSAVQKTPFFSERFRSVFNAFRQIFLFLPGTSFLYLASIVLTFRLLSGFNREDVGFLLIESAIFFVSAFLTVLGLGDWRKPRHFAIPLSIIAIGTLFGIVGVLLFDGGIGLRIFLQYFIPYYFPLAFIVPVLVKGWLDKTEG